MVVLGLLQNQWARNPAAVAAMFARRPEQRQALIKFMLARSKSGRRLRAAFGPWVDRIIWENASPVVAERAGGRMPVDRAHVNAILAKVSPDVVVAFGVSANQAITISSWCGFTIVAPHPTARVENIEARLVAARTRLDAYAEGT